jgi:hypothetical protein
MFLAILTDPAFFETSASVSLLCLTITVPLKLQFVLNPLLPFLVNVESTQCPQRGCYDCPRYKDEPGSNPYFQERLARATHTRADYFKKTGIADSFRNTAEL